jgi:hypothetical protein
VTRFDQFAGARLNRGLSVKRRMRAVVVAERLRTHRSRLKLIQQRHEIRPQDAERCAISAWLRPGLASTSISTENCAGELERRDAADEISKIRNCARLRNSREPDRSPILTASAEARNAREHAPPFSLRAPALALLETAIVRFPVGLL